MNERVEYRSSSFCPNGDCIEVAQLADGMIAIRHSGTEGAEPMVVTRSEWDAFLQGVGAGEFTFLDAPR